MIRALWYFFIVVAAAALAAAIAGLDGDIVATVGDTEIAMSLALALGLVALLIAVGLMVGRVVTFVLRGPGNVADFWASRKKMRGYEALSQGLLAVAAGDGAAATRHAAKAQKLLDQPAMPLLLAAQAARLTGDEAASATAFQAMLAAPETHGLALKGLFEHAMRMGDDAQAHAHAARALAAAPATPWAFEGTFAIEARRGDYEAALETLDRALGQGLLERPDARRRRAVLLTGLAQREAARIGDPDALRDEEDIGPDEPGTVREIRAQALRHAVEARDLAPDLVPAAALAAQLIFEDGRARRAQKIIEDAWSRGPHPQLADVFFNLFPEDAASKRLKRAQALAARAPGVVGGAVGGEVEGDVLVARAAIAARRFDDAKTALAAYAEPFPSRRICLLMAEIAEGMGDRGATRGWLSRAVKAPADAQWVAEGYHSATWLPVVPATGAFDALKWRAPADAIVALDSPSTEQALARAAKAVVLPVPPPRPDTMPPDTVARDTTPHDAAASLVAVAAASPPVPAAPEPVSPEPVSPEPVSPEPAPLISAPPVPAPELLDIQEEIDYMPPRPDDPGPDAYDDEDEDRRASW